MSSKIKKAQIPASQKKLKGRFKVGDLITGKDRSYSRSIYKVIGPHTYPEMLLLEFVSLGSSTIDSFKDSHSPLTLYQVARYPIYFRKATRVELKESNKARVIYRLHRLLLKLDLECFNIVYNSPS